MNTPGIEFGRKTSAAYAALCKPLCQKLHLPQTAFDILMFLANNPGYQTASDVVEVRKLKANLVSVNVDRLVQEGYLVRDGKIASPVRGASLIGKGDICNFVGIIILAGLTIVCFVQLALSLARRKQWLLCVIAILEVLVLVLAASGILVGGGH